MPDRPRRLSRRVAVEHRVPDLLQQTMQYAAVTFSVHTIKLQARPAPDVRALNERSTNLQLVEPASSCKRGIIHMVKHFSESYLNRWLSQNT